MDATYWKSIKYFRSQIVTTYDNNMHIYITQEQIAITKHNSVVLIDYLIEMFYGICTIEYNI